MNNRQPKHTISIIEARIDKSSGDICKWKTLATTEQVAKEDIEKKATEGYIPMRISSTGGDGWPIRLIILYESWYTD